MGLGDKLKPYPALHKLATKVFFLREEYIYLLYLKFFYLWEYLKKKDKKIILFYPDLPKYDYMVYQICHFSGYTMTNNPQKADLVIRFEDTTFGKYHKELDKLDKKHKIINSRCLDISKRKIDEIHTKIFGYSISINPQTFKGKYVRKPNINSYHGGQILDRPEKSQEGYVYQRLVNNIVNNELVEYRVPIIGNTIPIIYIKYRSEKDRFGDQNNRVEIDKLSKHFSKDEQFRIIKFCNTLGLDCGEMDILRDMGTGKLYIVDANNTPTTPPFKVSPFVYRKALQIMSDVFHNSFLI